MEDFEVRRWEAQRWNYIQENDLPNSCFYCKGLGFNCWLDPCPKSHFKADDAHRIEWIEKMEKKHDEHMKKLGLYDYEKGESLW